MDEKLITILETFKYPVLRQGSMEESEQYPPTFLTFWNTESADHAHYNNEDYGTVWEFDVNVYSTVPDTTYTLLSQVRKALKENGFIVPGKGHDVASDEVTHTGRGLTALFLEIENEEDTHNE